MANPAEQLEPFYIVGVAGMLGRAWRELLDRRRLGWAGADLPVIDITDAASIEKNIGPEVRTVVNCAAYTAVDKAETEEALATKINGDAVRLLAARCRAIGATLVHYSTDYVFDGQATRPYAVDQAHAPVNAYGRSKAAGERALFESGARRLLIRTSWLYAPWGRNFVRTMIRLTREKPELKVIDDQRGRPTSAEHLAATSLALLERGASGTLHVTDGGECTWYGLTREIARLVGHRACDIRPCTTAEYPTPARRPAYSVLDLGTTESILGPMPDWHANLADVIGRVEPD